MQKKIEKAYRSAIDYFADFDMVVRYIDGRLSPEKSFEAIWNGIKNLPIISL